MARNKGKQYLDQPTRYHLDALDSFIDETLQQSLPKQEDEFTVYDYIERTKLKGAEMSVSTGSKNLKTLVKEGRLSQRKSKHNGYQIVFYRFVK